MSATNRWAYVRKAIAALAVITFVVGVFGSAAQARTDRLDREARFEIPAQSLATALVQFARQAELQLVTSSVELGSRETSGISGRLSVRRALESLLDRTGLAFTLVGENTVAIGPAAGATGSNEGALPSSNVSDRTPSSPHGAGGAQTAGSDVSSKPGFWNRLRPAQKEGGRESDDSVAGQQDHRVPRSSSVDVSGEAMGEIVVTGTNIRGVYPASSPVTIYTAEDIARTGATTTEQFFQRLPENHGTRTQNAPGSTPTANHEAVSTVDLRGLGVGTTLVLINGRRVAPAGVSQAVDISMIPVSAIERMEILTDGASAIYGSDAIGGVVNLVLRNDLDGAETTLSYGGVNQGGLQQGAVAQSVGADWSAGRALVAYNYFSASDLQQRDRSYASAAGGGTLLPDTERHGVLATMSQDLGDRATLSGDFLFARRDNESTRTLLNSFQTSQSASDQYFGTLALDWTIAADWHAALSATYSENNTDVIVRSVAIPGGGVSFFDLDSFGSGYDFSAMLDGTLFNLPGGTVRFSIGAGYVSEKFARPERRDLERETRSYFGELLIPLISKSQGAPFVRRLELSLAARRTEYGDRTDPELGIDFGEKTSPKVGLLWSPAEGLNLRATHGESFRAAPLAQLDPAGAFNSISPPGFFGTPDIWSPTGDKIGRAHV